MPQQHISRTRGADVAPRSAFLEGRFGRMFRNVPSFDPDIERLREVSERMRTEMSSDEKAGRVPDGPIPAGYTYLGQFIDHDITFDPVSSLQRQNDPDALHNFRTPRFDLDSIYGDGPNNNPFLYDPDVDDGRTSFLIGKNKVGEDDLPRNVLPPAANDEPRGRALIGDPRNDENIIVSQLHLLFLKFHNKVVGVVRSRQPALSHDELFEEAQRIVRWHYQWIVGHDFLRRVVGEEVIRNIAVKQHYKVVGEKEVELPRFELRFYHWQREPFMPVEFSAAAYRFGHSMIRPSYKINVVVPELPIFPDNPAPGPLEAFHGFRPLPPQWTVDWEFFFELGDRSRLQMARKIDTSLAEPTFKLPGLEPPSLAFRNLRRGKVLGLPSGQRVAHAMGITDPLTDEQLGITPISDEFVGNAPLWFYVLREADQLSGGERLGPIGGRIVAEVLLGLLKGDPTSYINVDPNWTPEFGGGDDFSMPDLVRFTLEA